MGLPPNICLEDERRSNLHKIETTERAREKERQEQVQTTKYELIKCRRPLLLFVVVAIIGDREGAIGHAIMAFALETDRNRLAKVDTNGEDTPENRFEDPKTTRTRTKTHTHTNLVVHPICWPCQLSSFVVVYIPPSFSLPPSPSPFTALHSHNSLHRCRDHRLSCCCFDGCHSWRFPGYFRIPIYVQYFYIDDFEKYFKDGEEWCSWRRASREERLSWRQSVSF